MATIKKVKPIRIIEQGEFIDTLDMPTYWQEQEEHPSDKNKNDCEKYVSIFETTYGHSLFVTIYEIFRWEDYIWQGKNSINKLDAYKNYAECIARNQREPLKTKRFENSKETGTEWVFNGYAYEVKGLYTDNEIRLLILEDFDKERRYFEKLKIKFDETKESESTNERPRIPENIRIEVWRRDGGKCARCGNREKLEYDHIVPISRGGSNTARNIELLCEKCNRSKSNNVV
jgi:hypothetical protein